VTKFCVKPQEGLMTKKLLMGAAIALSVLGIFGQGMAGAAPAPAYTVACAVGFNTTANWQHVKLSQVTFHWLAPEGSSTIFQDITVPITKKAPHGFAFSTTPPSSVHPDRVVVSFTHADGSGTDTVEAGCS
jgi:hypothetical protein